MLDLVALGLFAVGIVFMLIGLITGIKMKTWDWITGY